MDPSGGPRPARRLVPLAVAALVTTAVMGALAGCAAILSPGSLVAGGSGSADVQRPLSEADQRLVLATAGAALFYAEAGRLAEQQATDPMVRTYAALLAQHHSGASEELRALVQGRGIVWPGGPPAARQSVLDALTALTPDVFDRRFVERVGIADHENDLVLFETASRSLGDPELRAWAARMVPVLQNHLATARQLPLRRQARAVP